MSERALQKWHGAGNDFLIDVLDVGGATWWSPERAAAACDRHRGVGADGLLVAEVGERVAMTLYNADGSLAEMSGNGVRCLVGAVARRRGLREGTMQVDTEAGSRSVRFELFDGRGHAAVDMGPVSLEAPLAGTLGVARVGNPHVVVRDREEWDDREREAVAAPLADAVDGANVEFVAVEDEHRVRLRVIERGVGWTLACGTGSCAVAKVLADRGEVTSPLVVVNPGGELEVSLEGDRATLAGPMALVGDVAWVVR